MLALGMFSVCARCVHDVGGEKATKSLRLGFLKARERVQSKWAGASIESFDGLNEACEAVHRYSHVNYLLLSLKPLRRPLAEIKLIQNRRMERFELNAAV